MNNQRRKDLQEVIKVLSSVGFDDAKDSVESIMGDEQDAFDNMPESLQNGERGQQMQDALDRMQQAIDALDAAQEALSEAIEAIESATA